MAKINMKITNVKCHWNPPGANALITWRFLYIGQPIEPVDLHKRMWVKTIGIEAR